MCFNNSLGTVGTCDFLSQLLVCAESAKEPREAQFPLYYSSYQVTYTLAVQLLPHSFMNKLVGFSLEIGFFGF